MDFNGISSQYTEYLKSSAGASEKMNNISNLSGKDATDEEMMSACKQFEEYLVEMVMKEVTKTVDIMGTSGVESSAAISTTKDVIKDALVQKMAGTVSEGTNLGIAQQLYESMKRNRGEEI